MRPAIGTHVKWIMSNSHYKVKVIGQDQKGTQIRILEILKINPDKRHRQTNYETWIDGDLQEKLIPLLQWRDW